jgi:hypothetical protein
MRPTLRFLVVGVLFLSFSQASRAQGIRYEDGVLLTQAQVDACRRVVEPLQLPEEELNMSCGAEGDNVGPGTTATRIAAGRGFVGCVRGLQGAYRRHGHDLAIDRSLITCAYLSTPGRNVVAAHDESFESCLAPAARAGRRPDARVRVCISEARAAGASGATYGYDAALRGASRSGSRTARGAGATASTARTRGSGGSDKPVTASPPSISSEPSDSAPAAKPAGSECGSESSVECNESNMSRGASSVETSRRDPVVPKKRQPASE